jgi:hypothetical protein
MSLKAIISKLTSVAESNEERAYKILGARPGPGIDLLIKPMEPMQGKWFVTGRTAAGGAFINKFWRWQPLSNQKLAEMKKQAHAWNLTFRTDYPIVSGGVTLIDPL